MPIVPHFWVVVPAAGSARRMGGEIPKQYLRIAGSTVIEHAIRPFLARQECRGIVVTLAADDHRFGALPMAHDPRVRAVTGGAERTDSVRAGLTALSEVRAGDWVLVHDAARPCLSDGDLALLLQSVGDDEVGGLLATPVVDTLKRGGEGERVAETVDRMHLWHALTPQMFRYELLMRALTTASDNTDESQAVERLGLKPKLVRGNAENLKITMPDDVARAERILMARAQRSAQELAAAHVEGKLK